MKEYKPFELWSDKREYMIHSDFMLEPGDKFSVNVNDETGMNIKIQDGLVYKVHLMYSLQPFLEEKQNVPVKPADIKLDYPFLSPIYL